MRKIVIILIVFISSSKLYCQEISKSNFSIRYAIAYDWEVKVDYNYIIVHNMPVFSYRSFKHDFYVGPQYSYFFQPKPVANEIFSNNVYGFNFGYRYYGLILKNKFQIFGQLNFSFYGLKIKEYEHGVPFVKEHYKYIIENTLTIGIDYRINKSMNVFIGVGFGSFNGFFLMLDNFAISNYFGIEYKI